MSTLSRRAIIAAASSSALVGCRKKSHDGRAVARLWFCYGGNNRVVLLDLVNKFNKLQGAAVVEPVFQGDYFESLAKLRTAIAAGVPPTFSHVLGEVIPYLSTAGVLEPLDDYPGARRLDFVKQLAQHGAFENGDKHPMVALPFNRSTPIMYTRQDMMDDYRLKAPRTWDELLFAAKRLYRNESDGGLRWGFEVPIDWWFWLAMVGQAGGRVIEPDGRITLGGDAGVRALQFWQSLVHEHKVMRPPPGRDFNAWDAANTDFLAGRAGITWTSTAYLRYIEKNARFRVVTCPLPGDVRRSVPTGGTFFVMLKDVPQAEKIAAWSFLKWMCEPEQTIEWATRTGYLPVTNAAVNRLRNQGYYDKHPNDWVAYEQLDHADPWPWSTTLFRIERDIVNPRLEEAILTNRNAKDALRDAREEAGTPS